MFPKLLAILTSYFQCLSVCALILNLQLRTLPLEPGSAEQVPALSLWAHNSLAARRCLLASVTSVILTAALAVAVFIPASLSEGVFLVSDAASFFFVFHICVAHSFGPSV